MHESKTVSTSDIESHRLNGAQTLVEKLEQSGVTVCFANPGTSEMHFVAALDRSDSMRSILCLAETVVTGAADGYARMSDKPGVTLLHTGPGLGNGIANLHNAKKALTPIVNVVGEHATYHVEYDAPLTADINALATPVSHWVDTCQTADEVEGMTLEAMHQATTHPGRIATLILPADAAWSDVSPTTEKTNSESGNDKPGTAAVNNLCSHRQAGPTPAQKNIKAVAELLRKGEPAVMILTGNALRERGLEAASRLRQATGVEFLAQTSNARLARGEGRVYIEPVPYQVDAAQALLSPYRHVIRVCAKAPVAFFAYPDKPSTLSPADANVVTLAEENEDGIAALEALVQELQAEAFEPELEPRLNVSAPAADAAVDSNSLGQILCTCLPANAIVVDEAITNGARLPYATRGAKAHDWLQICGGAIGDGMPLATGAAIACPDRRVVTVQADGSGMYCLQALWTQARENLDITTIVLANRAYAILKYEFKNVGAHQQKHRADQQGGPSSVNNPANNPSSANNTSNGGQTARDLMELDRPSLDWVSLAEGMGVSGERVTTNAGLQTALERALSTKGPRLIEVLL